ncbi:MAG: 23S rRNA (guanosine(2251)-2'-O)-methyltransferase RlmB [Oscillospiraceae bacterium]|nr:23S rRNA (guanosine(2251)-2'-O)-methyltransferase RlmB [Oscillospiraceae bacterium]
MPNQQEKSKYTAQGAQRGRVSGTSGGYTNARRAPSSRPSSRTSPRPRPAAAPEPEKAAKDELVFGKNSVLEALASGAPIEKLYIAKEDTTPTAGKITRLARDAKIVVSFAASRKLDDILVSNGFSGKHQGVIGKLRAAEYSGVEDILAESEKRGEPPFIVICDGLTDPHNLGAVIRSAEGAGVHGVIIPKHNSAGLTAAVSKTSSGAIFHMKVAQVTNLSQTIDDLKAKNVWIYGLAGSAEATIWDTDLSSGGAFVIGAEGDGISRLVLEKCDFTASIPMKGAVSSLNASVSAGVVLYEALRQMTAKAAR